MKHQTQQDIRRNEMSDAITHQMRNEANAQSEPVAAGIQGETFMGIKEPETR